MKNLEMIVGQAVILGLTASVIYYIIKHEYDEEKKDMQYLEKKYERRRNDYIEHLRENGL